MIEFSVTDLSKRLKNSSILWEDKDGIITKGSASL